jgi:hypothetical protein
LGLNTGWYKIVSGKPKQRRVFCETFFIRVNYSNIKTSHSLFDGMGAAGIMRISLILATDLK